MCIINFVHSECLLSLHHAWRQNRAGRSLQQGGPVVHDNLVRVLIGLVEWLMHFWVELLDAVVDDHGWSLDAEVP